MQIPNSTPIAQLAPTTGGAATPPTRTNEATDAGALQLASLRETSDEAHVREHIRGIVAATMSNLSVHASDGVKNHARGWQQWALGIADGVDMPVTAPLV